MLHFQVQATPFGEYTTLDLTAWRIARLKTRFSYGHPAIASWTMFHPQHTLPLGIRQFIRLWDDADPSQSESNPHYEGFIEEVSPGSESGEVRYVAYDPTRKSTAELCVMSAAWDMGSIGEAPPTEGFGTYPRLVFNSKIDNDDDYAFERAHDYSLAEMISTILEDQYHPLYWSNAAPGDGSSAGNGLAYDADDLAPLSFRPQEKLVFESESVRSALERLLQWEPAYRLLWQPGTRQWRFFDVTQAEATTLNLNDIEPPVVLSLELHRSLEGRYTAVKIYGPEKTTDTTLQVSTGGLTVIPSGILLQNDIGTCCNVDGLNQWQITNASRRRIARLLNQPIAVQYSDYYYATTRSPVLLGYWPMTSAGNAGWRVIQGWILDSKTGVIRFPNSYVFRFNPSPASGQPQHENPTDVRFVCSYYDEPLSVRYPDVGFSGSAYTVAGLQNELKLYDEMLAVGYEYGTPVTTPTRMAQFQILAQRIHAMRRDLIYAGGCTLDGLDYRFHRLNRRINFAGVDANGATVTTGWEEIGALVTDVEYDFEQQLTTVQFSSDQLEMIGMDPEQMKERLRIRALELRTWSQVSYGTTLRNRLSTDATGFHFVGDTLQTTITVNAGKAWVDPETGELG